MWLLFIFHANTDLHRLWSASHAGDGLKAKVGVPRLNGGRLGVLATRSPHRPSPIGGSCQKYTPTMTFSRRHAVHLLPLSCSMTSSPGEVCMLTCPAWRQA